MQQAWHRKNVCAGAPNSGRLVSSHVSRDPRNDRGLWVHRAEELVRQVSSAQQSEWQKQVAVRPLQVSPVSLAMLTSLFERNHPSVTLPLSLIPETNPPRG